MNDIPINRRSVHGIIRPYERHSGDIIVVSGHAENTPEYRLEAESWGEYLANHLPEPCKRNEEEIYLFPHMPTEEAKKAAVDITKYGAPVKGILVHQRLDEFVSESTPAPILDLESPAYIDEFQRIFSCKGKVYAPEQVKNIREWLIANIRKQHGNEDFRPGQSGVTNYSDSALERKDANAETAKYHKTQIVRPKGLFGKLFGRGQ
jgi:hypothetical protein